MGHGGEDDGGSNLVAMVSPLQFEEERKKEFVLSPLF
jgi:hypothetical protein